MSKKPVAIIEDLEHDVVRLLIRIDEKKQIEHLTPFLYKYLRRKSEREDFEAWFTNMVTQKKSGFVSYRVPSTHGTLDLLFIENKDALFLFCVFGTGAKDFKRITGYTPGQTLKWTMNQPD